MLARSALVVPALITLVSCSNGGTSPDAAPLTDAGDATHPIDAAPDAGPPAQSALIARFNVTAGAIPPAFEIPFPSDLYRDPSGFGTLLPDDFSGLNLDRASSVFTASFGAIDGFGLNTGGIFVIDSTVSDPMSPPYEVDVATLPVTPAASLAPGATAFIVDLDPSVPAASARIPSTAGWHSVFRTIVVIPEHAVLTPGHQYAAVITTGIHSMGAGPPLSAAPIFSAIRDIPSQRIGALGMLYGSAVDRVVAIVGPPFNAQDIAALAVFTAQTTPHQMQLAHDAMTAMPTPVLNTDPSLAAPFHIVRFGATHGAADGWTATLDEWLGTPFQYEGQDVAGFPVMGEPGVPADAGLAHDAIGAIMSATFVATSYQDSMGHIQTAADGTPTITSTSVTLPFTLVLPRGAMPTNGYPVVIFGHGLGNQHREMMSIANSLARQQIATAAMDHVDFGLRLIPADTLSLESGTYNGPDGFGDSSSYAVATFFGNLTDLLAFRDNLRESALDLLQFRRMLANTLNDLSFVADEYGGTAPRLDTTHIGYVGHSLGGIIGTVFAANDPAVNPVVLNVTGGAFITHLAADAPDENALLATAGQLVFGAPTSEPFDRFNPLSNVIQMIIDGADPASFASLLTHPMSGRPHDVWLTEALWDETVSNSSTELLATIMGLPQVVPVSVPVAGLTTVMPPVAGNLAMGTTGAYLQNTPATHGASLDARYGENDYRAPFPVTDGTSRFPMLTTPYLVRQWIVPYQANIASFMTSAFTTGTASITIAGMIPVIDHDDDGWSDADEMTAGTDPDDPTSHPSGTAPITRDVEF